MTLLRKAEHRALLEFPVAGEVVDLGGDARSEYLKLIPGERTLTVVNMDPKARPDVLADLEEPLPLPDAAYDGALLINVLEHVYRYERLLTETHRILKPGGTALVVVPYLFPYHPSPNDFHRWSQDALVRHLTESGFSDVCITPLGSGVFAARYLFLERLVPSALQDLLGIVFHPFVVGLDALFAKLASMFGKSYRTSDYALGFYCRARK